jgi:membrane protein YqaA with SNARE-associated domain
MAVAGHPRASVWLGVVSFAESSFFPVPPDVLLGPMALARPRRAWWLALLTTLTSVAGALLGYAIGAGLYEAVARPLIQAYGVSAEYRRVAAWFGTYGGWAVFLAGLTPIPYKVFTIAAGSLAMPLLPFVLASLAGRGLRFFAVAAVAFFGGQRLYDGLERWSPLLFWLGMAGLGGLLAHAWLGGG